MENKGDDTSVPVVDTLQLAKHEVDVANELVLAAAKAEEEAVEARKHAYEAVEAKKAAYEKATAEKAAAEKAAAEKAAAEKAAAEKAAAEKARKQAAARKKAEEEEAEARAKEKAAADAKVVLLANIIQFLCVFSTLCFLCLRGMDTIEFETILASVPVKRANSLARFCQPRKPQCIQ